MRNGNYESEDEGGVEPHYQQGSTRGLYTYVYVNGDEHFLPKKLLVNPKRDRTYNAFLDYATKVLNPRYGAVRNIYTPEGRHRIRGFEDMQPDGRYVACGRERYKRLDRPYTQIEAPSPRRRNRHSNRDERLIPAHHNKHLENVTGKISQIPTQGKAIEVFVNGQDIDKPTTVGLSYRQLENMTEAIKVVHEAIREKHQYRVDQICDLEGHVVTDVNQLETGGLYVAKNSYHTFKPGRYEPHGRKNIIVPLSPRDKQQTKYLWKERSTFGGPGDYRRPRTLPPINSQKKHSPDHSVSSYPETRKRNQVNGVPVKAAKHTKRTPKQADYDKDDGGVFKAKGQSRDTRGAKEVRDNGDTKVDLPIDQVRAEEVKEEENLIDETEAKVPSGVELSRQPSESSEQQDERIKKERQGKDINNKPPTKQADHSHSKTMQNGDRSQADHSHSRTIQNGDRSQAKGDQSKPVVNNSQNKTVQNTKQSTYKSNSKAPPPNTTKNDVKKQEPLKDNDVKKQEPPKDNKNYKNHDSVRSSTPKDNKAAPPSKSPADKRSITPAKSPVNNKAASPARSPSPTKDKKDPTPHEEHQAATKIQANYRGHQARKEVNDLKTKKETDEKKKKEDEQRAKQAKEENQAATKIQAGFRGHQARKEINQKKQESDASGQNNSGTVPPPMHNARPAPNGAKPGSTDSKPDTKPTPGTDAKNTPNVKDTKGSDPNKKTDVNTGDDVKTSGPDTKPADPNAKPLAGPDAKPSGPDSKPPAGDSKKPPVGDSNPATGDNKPPAGDKKPPPGDSKPPAGDNKPPAGDNKPSAGDNKPPAGDNKPPAGDNKPPAGDNKPSADPNQQPTDNKPTAGPDSGPDNNANT
ncbi:doublecortin domain-containing protein 2-like isoform X5 [Mytilus californianus]|uniref:doublecortin domain-containing protein 2-like isoform X5 n=1 Tax=Mytilus californianus TaxID=6549 RepID=UPI0022487261|nr:doublecortin domain-containing protein 2-like isoform X5 [Mytilus californianus]